MSTIVISSTQKKQALLTLEDEKELLASARQGCRRSIHKLLEAYSPLLRQICRQLFASHDREEYEQQAWIEAYELIAGYKNDYGVGSYLKEYLPKRLLTYTHHNRYQVKLTDYAIGKFKAGLAPELEQLMYSGSSDALDQYACQIESPDQVIEQWDISKQVQEVINSLPEKQSYVLTELFLKNKAPQILAKELDMTPQGVSILKKRTLKRLKQHPQALQLAHEIPEIAAMFCEKATPETTVQPEVNTVAQKLKSKSRLSLLQSLLTQTTQSLLYWASTIISKPMQSTVDKPSALQFFHKVRPVTYLRLATLPFMFMAFTHDPIWSIPALMIGNYLNFTYIHHSLKKLPPRVTLAIAGMAIGSMSLYASPVFAQVEFSFLLGATEEMLKSCFFTSNQFVTFVIGALAALFRGGVAWQLGHEAFDWVQAKRQDQSGSHHLKNLGWGLLAFIIVGAFEPYLARPCAAAGGAPTAPTAPTP